MRTPRTVSLRGYATKGIACGRYFEPIHLLPYYRRVLGGAEGDHPIAEQAARRTLALPFFNAITEAQVDEVCDRLLRLI